jgi:hypothetical protein
MMNDPQQQCHPSDVGADGAANEPGLAHSPIKCRRKAMTKCGSLETQRKNQEWEQQRAQHLTEVAHQWNVAILQGLQDLAQAAWPNWHMLGLVSIRRYCLRHQVTPEAQVWWVEHDVPLDDQHLCAAFRVQLTLDDRDEPMLTVHSGTAIYPVTPLTVEALNTTLAQTGQDLPLLIPRKIDAAKDP